MRLSTKGRYGIRLMIDLASNYADRPVLLKDIAKRQDVSEKYLWHLIDSLKIAGLVNSTRGARGGYSLAKLPSQISLKDIVLATEGDLSVVECVGNPSLCERSDTCVSFDIWKEISDKISETLSNISLQQMVERQREKMKQA